MIGMNRFCWQNYWNNRKAKAEQNAGIIGVNLSKIKYAKLVTVAMRKMNTAI